MATATDFFSQLDEEGRFRDREGVLDVVFATRGGGRYPGKLQFRDGLCVRAEMEGGGDWGHPDHSPLDGIKFLLNLGDGILQGIAINQGRIVRLDEARKDSTKREFLRNFSIARNLFAHPQVESDSPNIDKEAIAGMLARAAIWLTPRSVAGFNAADFPELGPNRQKELQSAVEDFLSVANQVPADKPATDEQYRNASVAFMKLLDILGPYLPIADESKEVEEALRCVRFPPWVVNWDFELGSDSEGAEAIWVNVFADEQSLPSRQLGRAASELATKVRQALSNTVVDRWPYIRMKTALEHKAGAR
jgi:hypothetical protein